MWPPRCAVATTVVALHCVAFGLCDNNDERQMSVIEQLDAKHLAETRGFELQTHRVVTDDAYVLHLHRLINPHINAHERKGVVIMQHGILCASPFFLMNSCASNKVDRAQRKLTHTKGSNLTAALPSSSSSSSSSSSNSLAIELANRGYDVWLANFRGTQYSRGHEDARMQPTTGSQYWNFNVDTLVEHDLGAYVRYVLAHTRAKSYTFVGHSLGATVGLGSLLVHHNTPVVDRLSCSVLMAPVASTQFMRGSLLPLFRLATLLYNSLAPFPGASGTFARFARRVCLLMPDACISLASMFIGPKQSGRANSHKGYLRAARNAFNRLINGDFAPYSNATLDSQTNTQINTFVLMMHQSVSIQMLQHIVQVHLSGRLAHYNYGPAKNEQLYGARLAPAYELSRVTATHTALAVVGGPSDVISTPDELEWIGRQVRGRVRSLQLVEVDVSPFNHMDLIMSADAGRLVNDRVLDFMNANACSH